MSKIPIASSSEKKVEVKTEIQETKGPAVQTPESTNKTILKWGLDPLLRDKIFQKPDMDFSAEFEAYYFKGPDAIYKGSAAFDHSFSQDQKSGYYTQLGAWLERVRTLSTEVKFDGFSSIETLINKLRNPKIYYNFATDAIRDKTVASVKRSLEFILLKLLKKFQLAKDSSQSIQDEIIAILLQIAEAGERCTSQLKNIEATVDLLSLDPGLIGRIHAYLLEVILPKFYQRCIAEQKLHPDYHVHVAGNTRMWLSETIADLHWLKPSADDDFAQVHASEEVIRNIRAYIATHLINTLREEFTFEAICLREVVYRLPQRLAILKKYRGQDLNRFVFSIEEESNAETQGELDREVKGPAGKEMKSEQDREVKGLPGKEIKSERDREVKRHPSQETKNEPDAKQQLTQVSNLLENEFKELIHFGACKKSDLIACDEEHYTQLIINPEFEANLFSYYMNYVAQIMFEQELAGEFSSYAAAVQAAKMSTLNTANDLIDAFREGQLYKAKILVDVRVDCSNELNFLGEGEDERALSIILDNYNFKKEKEIYVDPHSQMAALNLLLTSKKPVDINRLSYDFLHNVFKGYCHSSDAFSRLTDWILSQDSGLSVFQHLIFNKKNLGRSAIDLALINALNYKKPDIFLIILKKIKINDLKPIMAKVIGASPPSPPTLLWGIMSLISSINNKKSDQFDPAGFSFCYSLNQFEDLLIILRKQCDLTPECYLFLADYAGSLEKVMLVLEFYPGLADKYDWSRSRHEPNISAIARAAEDGQVKYLEKILSIPSVDPNCFGKDRYTHSYPIMLATKSGKNAKQQKKLVRLFLEHKKLVIEDYTLLMLCATAEACYLDTFELLLKYLLPIQEQKSDSPEKTVLKRIDSELVAQKILEKDDLSKLKIWLQNVKLDKFFFVTDPAKKCGDIINFLFNLKDAGPEKIIVSYAKYCSRQYRGENFDPALARPVFSPELRIILDKQFGSDLREYFSGTVSEFNTAHKFGPFLTLVMPDPTSLPLSPAEFKSGVQYFLNEVIRAAEVSEHGLYNYINIFFLIYSYKRKKIDSDNGSVRFDHFLSVLFKIVPKEYKLRVIASFLMALVCDDVLNAADIFCNELITESTAVADDEFLLSVLKFLEEKLKNFPKQYDQFIKFIFDKLQKYPSFSQCSELYYYLFVFSYSDTGYYEIIESAVKSSIENNNNFLLNKLLKYLSKKGLKKLPKCLESGYLPLTIAILSGNDGALRILLHPDYISMLELDEETLQMAAEHNCSFNTIKAMLTLLPMSVQSDSPYLNGFFETAIEKDRWDLVLLASSCRGIIHDWYYECSESHRLYNSVRNIVLAIDMRKSLDEINNLLADFDLASTGSEFSRIDLVKIIHNQHEDQPALYALFFTHLFDQTIRKSDADPEQKETKEMKREYKEWQKALPVEGIEKALVKALEAKPLSFLCDALTEGKTDRVMHALNNGANPAIGGRIFSPLELALRNAVGINDPRIFSAEDQLLIVNAILSRTNDGAELPFAPWAALYQSRHVSFALCLRFSHLRLPQPELSVRDGHRAHLIYKMRKLWKGCSEIKQPDQCHMVAAHLLICVENIAPKMDAELTGNILTELKKQLSQFREEYYRVIALCYGVLSKSMIKKNPQLVSNFCRLAWVDGDRVSPDAPSFLPLKTLVEKDFITSIFFTEAITSNRDYSEALSLLLNSPVILTQERRDVLVQFLSTDKYQYESKAGAIYTNEQKQLPACEYVLQSGDAELLSRLLALRGNPSLPVDDLKSYPVRLAICQHPEWLEVKESKQTLLSFTAAKPNNAKIIAYFKGILPQVLSITDLTSVHTALLDTHKIELQDIIKVGIYQAIFETILRPRMKLQNIVPASMSLQSLDR